MHSDVDKVRDQTDKRKLLHSEIEKSGERRARDQTPKRRKMHSIIDKIRDNTPKRKQMHQNIDRKRNQTDEYKYYKKAKDNLRYQKKLYDTFDTDTGFDVICGSCLQYKSLEYCKPTSILNEELQRKYIVKHCALLQDRSSDQHVCNLCLKEIKRNKTPKRSKKSKFKFANFPKYLIQSLKKICNVNQRGNVKNQEEHDRQILKLNRLECFLLKLVIPFIRVAHCPRGVYFKVKGDLILISSDISHSLSKVLPVNQGLIPVCFKRKLSYGGSYIEEYIEREKVKQYYSWYKKYNHLYKDTELDPNLVEEFIDDSKSASKDFERITKKENEDWISDESDNESLDDDDGENLDIDFLTKDFYEPCKKDQEDVSHDQTTMFLNKYCENIEIPSVANRLADTIIEYEVNQSIPFHSRNDDEIDDEIITEEEFLWNIDQEMNDLSSYHDYQNPEIEETMEDIMHTHREVDDEISSHIEMLSNPSEKESEVLAKCAKREAESAVQKMEKYVWHLVKKEHSKIGMKIYFWRKNASLRSFHMELAVI